MASRSKGIHWPGKMGKGKSMHSLKQVGMQMIERPDSRTKNSFSTVTSMANGGKVLGNPGGRGITTARMQSSCNLRIHNSVASGLQRMQPPSTSLMGTASSLSKTQLATPTSVQLVTGSKNSNHTRTRYWTVKNTQPPTLRGGKYSLGQRF